MPNATRRRFIGTLAGTGIVVGAGCLGDETKGNDIEAAAEIEALEDDWDIADDQDGPPIAQRVLPEDYTTEELTDAAMSGGPPPDGIPSIDDPAFTNADEPPPNLADESPVFGVEIDGDARAYSQNILVWHEIVNDVVGGESVAITYCPLTGTAQGFFRGDIEFGVSGRLINTNLVMFDRETESWWPQILAWGIRGPHENNYLAEFQVVWTTWARWREVYPETLVLSEQTGFLRNYGSDPYGSYLPPGGYYVSDFTMFPPLATDDRFHPKEVVIGARNADGAMCIVKEQIRDDRIIEGTLNDVPYVSVYDDALDTAHVYRNRENLAVTADGALYDVDGESYEADALPLNRQIAFDAMWMAWFGYYPSTTVHE